MRRSPSPSTSSLTGLGGGLAGMSGLRASYSAGLLASGGGGGGPRQTLPSSASASPPPRPQRPTRLLPGPAAGAASGVPPNYCYSCLPNGLSFSRAATAKQRALGPGVSAAAAAAAAAAARAGRSPGSAPTQTDRAYIGFATLPEQVHRKSVKRGFDFTLMVVGESGLGKSTLVNSLFLADLYRDRRVPDVSERIHRTTSIEKKVMDIEERGVKLRLTIVDTPGFGDALNCEESWRACCAYVDEQFRQYFTDESGLNRRNIQDNRVHCCLYFISPYGHGLRQLDVEFMRRLHRKVNLVPVIAKADTLTAAEVKRLKERVMMDLEEAAIQIYQFPECDSDEDEEFKQQDRELKACVPFAVVGASAVLDVQGRPVRGRQYPWGVVEVENPSHCDFARLRTMLVSTHMQDLKDVTQDVHYENFRAQCLSQMSLAAAAAGRERSKLKRDSGPPPGAAAAAAFADADTDRLLLQKDEEIRRMQDMLKQMQQKLTAQQGFVSPGDDGSRDSIVNV